MKRIHSYFSYYRVAEDLTLSKMSEKLNMLPIQVSNIQGGKPMEIDKLYKVIEYLSLELLKKHEGVIVNEKLGEIEFLKDSKAFDYGVNTPTTFQSEDSSKRFFKPK